MSKFKVGDRVKCIRKGAGVGDAASCKVGEFFRIVDTDVMGPFNSLYKYKLSNGNCTSEEGSFELSTPTLDNLQIDDVIEDDDGCEYTVLDVHGKVVDLADEDGHFSQTVSVKELKDNDFTVKGAEPELTEVTLEEVAKLKGVPVEQLRIKE